MLITRLVAVGGDGEDAVDYTERGAAVTIALNGQAVSGEAGEADMVNADVEVALGGAGNDVITGGNTGGRLIGNGGNDTIKAGTGEDRVESGEGDDTIDTRDGRFDSIDCGAGNDTLLADANDSATNCEAAPDRDGDGTPNEQDCAPDNAAVHPGAGEIAGNAADEASRASTSSRCSRSATSSATRWSRSASCGRTRSAACSG